MKKAFPVLWRYMLVVVTSCALAFFISQNTARAADLSVVGNANAIVGGLLEVFLA